MRIDQLPADLTGLPTATSASSSQNPKDEFLTLLVAQLQHQDPLDPQKGSDFIAQLAQFSSLEQATETNQRLGDLQAAEISASRTGYAALMGHHVTAKADSVTFQAPPSAPPGLSIHLDGPAAKVEVRITDATGNVVRTIELGPQSGGDVDTGWDGKSTNGNPVAAGTYKIAVTATGPDGTSTVTAAPQLCGTIDSMQFTDGAVRFRVGSATITPADFLTVGT